MKMPLDPAIAEKYQFVAEKLKRARSIAQNCAVVCFVAVLVIYNHSFLVPVIPVVMTWGVMAIITYSLSSIAEWNALQNKIENFWSLRIAAHIAFWPIGLTVAFFMLISAIYFPLITAAAISKFEDTQYDFLISLMAVIALQIFAIVYGYQYFLCHRLIFQALRKMIEIRRQDREAGSPLDGNPAGQPT